MNENPERSKTQTLEEFREEIRRFVEAEESGKEPTSHFTEGPTSERSPNFSVDELTEDDLRVWQKIKNGSITMEGWDAYKNSVPNKSAVSSRTMFLAFA